MHYKKIILPKAANAKLDEFKENIGALIKNGNSNLILDASNIADTDLIQILDIFHNFNLKRIKLIASGEVFQNVELIEKCFFTGIHSFVINLPNSRKEKSLKSSMQGISYLYRQSLAYKFPFFLALKINVNKESLPELFEYVKLLLGVIPDLLILNLNMAIREDAREPISSIIQYCESNGVWVKLEGIENHFGVNTFSWSDEE